MKGQTTAQTRNPQRLATVVTVLVAAVASALVASLALAWSAEVEEAESPAPVASQVQLYLKTRSELAPVLVWSREEVVEARANNASSALEMTGAVAGVAWCATGGEAPTPVSLTLELEGGGCVGLQAPLACGELRVGEPICVIAQPIQDGGGGIQLQVRAWSGLWDLPAEARPRAAQQAQAAPEQSGTTAEPPPPAPPTEEATAAQPDAVNIWRDWVLQHNSRLSAEQAESIVLWVLQAAARYNVNHRLIFAVIKWESWFDPACVSHAGAIGLMQLMPGTARGLGVDPWNVQQNIEGGVRYLAEQLATYADRSNHERVALALASYNAGPNAVKRAGGVPNIPETQRYVRKVSTTFRELHEAGFP